MAYMNQEKKAKIAEALKKVMPKDWKYSLAVRHHSTLVLTIKSAPINLVDIYTKTRFENREQYLERMYVDVNPYWWHDHFEGDLKEIFEKIFAALNIGNWNNSDSQTDYFDVGHYIDVQFGKWDKPFVVTCGEEQVSLFK